MDTSVEQDLKYTCITKCPDLDCDNIKHCTATAEYLKMLKDRGRDDFCPCGKMPVYELL